jgi:hypothetical protein
LAGRRDAIFAAGLERRETGLNALGVSRTEISKIGKAHCHNIAMRQRNKNQCIDLNCLCQSKEIRMMRGMQDIQNRPRMGGRVTT